MLHGAPPLLVGIGPERNGFVRFFRRFFPFSEPTLGQFLPCNWLFNALSERAVSERSEWLFRSVLVQRQRLWREIASRKPRPRFANGTPHAL